MAHSWGQLKIADGGNANGNSHPALENQVGKGLPNINVPRGTMVDAPYTRNPAQGNSKMVNGLVVNAMNPDKRKVTQANISNLHLDKLQYDKSGKANLGNLTNIYHQ
jgi:hypothetical protein